MPPSTPRAAAAAASLIGDSSSLAIWQVRNKREHCVNDVFHCVRDACGYLAGCAERWPASGLVRFCTGERPAHDLGTLKAAGREARICPYEITRAALAGQDVWIGDYNYVFAPDNRGLFYDQPGFDPARTLLVVDEAHNLPSRVADAYSHDAHEADARGLLAELDHRRAPAALILAVEEWARLLASLNPCDALDPAVEADLRDLLGRLAELVAVTPLDYAALGPRHSETLWQVPALNDFLADTTLRKLLWVPRTGELAFTCLDATEAIGATLRQYGGAILMSATLTPFARTAEACGLVDRGRELARDNEPKVGRAVPCPPFSGAEGTPRPTGPAYATLRAPAPWRDGAYDIAVDLRVDTSYRQRGNCYNTTAETVVALHAAAAKAAESHMTNNEGRQPSVEGRESKVEGRSEGDRTSVRTAKVPDKSEIENRKSGIFPSPAYDTPHSALRVPHSPVAVFFPSYAYAESVLQALDHGGSVLRVALQPRQSDLAAQTAWVEENLALADVLFLVLGSSFAEGIDLLGGRVTHAMVVGPALPEVNALQQARLDAFAGQGREAAFRRVYQIPGLQKVNQALGRLVRAPGQHAKVLLHCRRFAETSYATLLAPEYQFYTEIADDEALRAWLET
ncbi:MAG: helicase C-terminal domain-containing protein [Opitutales bacterium]